MISWREFVREVQIKNQISYKEAMSRASVLWKKKPHYEKKTKQKKGPKGIKKVPEITQFPKKLRFVKKKRELPDILTRVPRKRKRTMDLGPIDDPRFKYLKIGSDNIEV